MPKDNFSPDGADELAKDIQDTLETAKALEDEGQFESASQLLENLPDEIFKEQEILTWFADLKTRASEADPDHLIKADGVPDKGAWVVSIAEFERALSVGDFEKALAVLARAQEEATGDPEGREAVERGLEDLAEKESEYRSQQVVLPGKGGYAEQEEEKEEAKAVERLREREPEEANGAPEGGAEDSVAPEARVSVEPASEDVREEGLAGTTEAELRAMTPLGARWSLEWKGHEYLGDGAGFLKRFLGQAKIKTQLKFSHHCSEPVNIVYVNIVTRGRRERSLPPQELRGGSRRKEDYQSVPAATELIICEQEVPWYAWKKGSLLAEVGIDVGGQRVGRWTRLDIPRMTSKNNCSEAAGGLVAEGAYWGESKGEGGTGE